MALTQQEVLKIAHLARLAVADEFVPKYMHELSNILELVAQMDQINTDAITPMAHPLHEPQRLRFDEITEPNQRDLFQSIAPSVQAGLYLVPQVIETKE